MGVHVATRPSLGPPPHAPHAAHNQSQELLAAHPVEAVGAVRRAALGVLSASTDTGGLAEAATGRRRSGSGSFPVGAMSARARPSCIEP